MVDEIGLRRFRLPKLHDSNYQWAHPILKWTDVIFFLSHFFSKRFLRRHTSYTFRETHTNDWNIDGGKLIWYRVFILSRTRHTSHALVWVIPPRLVANRKRGVANAFTNTYAHVSVRLIRHGKRGGCVSVSARPCVFVYSVKSYTIESSGEIRNMVLNE